MRLPITSALALASATTLAQERPNIILFLVDDMGWQETSVPFWEQATPLNQRYRTPNMQRLAQRGVRFTNAYACAVSSPSRCSLLSGMNAARHRVTNWTLHYDQTTDAKSANLIPRPKYSMTTAIGPSMWAKHTSQQKERPGPTLFAWDLT